MYNKKIFMVIGMHRSGTSLVTNWLRCLGLQLSDSLVPPSSDNPIGFFEDEEIVRLNTRVESVIGRDHMHPTSILPLDENWVGRQPIIKIATEIKSYLEKKTEEKQAFLIKDPRLCRLLPLYFKLLNEIEVEPICIFVYRNPASVIRSKSKRDILNSNIVELQWQQANVLALKSISKRQAKTLFISYEDLVRNTKDVLKKIIDFLPESATENKSKKMPEIISDSFEERIVLDKKTISISGFSSELYAFFERVKNEPTKSLANFKDFPNIVKKFEQSHLLPDVSPWVSIVQSYSDQIMIGHTSTRQLARFETSLKKANGQVFGLNQQVQQLKNEIKDLRSQHTLLVGTHSKLAQKNSVLAKGHNELIEAHDELNRTHDGLRAQYVGKKNQFIELDNRFNSLEKEQRTLLMSHERTNRDYQVLLLKQRRKLYMFARKLDNFKRRIQGLKMFSLYDWCHLFYSNTYQNLVLVRRSLMVNGVRKTFEKIFRVGRLRTKNALFSNKHIDKSSPVILAKQNGTLSDVSSLVGDAFGLDEGQVKLFLDIFLSEYYREKAEFEENVSFYHMIDHFVKIGLKQGLSPSPMFNADFYIKKSGESDLENNEALLHWLKVGAHNKIVPTPLFDEVYFLQRHSLSLPREEWAFQRFLSLSVYNNASPNQYFDANWYSQFHQLENNLLPTFYHYLLIGAKLGWRPSPSFPSQPISACKDSELSPMEVMIEEIEFSGLRKRFDQSSVLMEMVNKAANLDSEILSPGGYRRLNIQPYSNPLFPAVKNIRKALDRNKYDSIVLIPHCRYGGSGLVAGEVCRSLVRCFMEENVLLIRTDNDAFMRPDWFPDSIDIVNLLDFCSDLPDVYRKKILLDMVIGLRPKRIINVHSRLGWELFVDYSDRLSHWSSLYGYTFCYDLNPLGLKVGYPIKYVPKIIQNLKKLFVDNSFLKDDLIKNNSWDKELSDKVSILWSPSKGNERTYNYEFDPVKKTPKRPKIFWAGRFDRQKRFDIVVRLAERNKEWDFFVWGAAMLDSEEKNKNLPENIKLQGLFNDYSEIPFEQCNVWLYTSEWDGLPTILIELGLIGIPLVSSSIWGTADVITRDTAWPVTKISSIKHYEQGINDILTNPTEALKRVKNMRELILSRHNSHLYDKSLQKVFFDDKWGSRDV